MLNDKIRDLYLNEKLSMREVAEKLNLNIWAVRSRMRRVNIPRRSPTESNAIKFLKTPLSYNEKTKLSQSETSLKISGLMLYWAEGSKRSKHTVDLANCDTGMLLIFLRMLRIIYRVNENKLRIYLYCFPNQDSQKLISYWSNLLKIPESQFTRPYVRKDFDPSKTDRMPNGMVHIRYADKRLLMQIKAEIDIIQKKLLS